MSDSGRWWHSISWAIHLSGLNAGIVAAVGMRGGLREEVVLWATLNGTRPCEFWNDALGR